MIDAIIPIEVLLNRFANTAGQILLAPIGVLPEFFAALLIAFLTGILMLLAFKFTSHQSAIQRVRNGIKAEFLAISLFKESIGVSLRSQLGIVLGAFKLMTLSLVPMSLMIIPVGLMLGQLSLWWQSQPIHVGEEAVICLNLAGDTQSTWPQVRLQPGTAVETILGPVRVRSQRAICWKIQAKAAGYHRLTFDVGGEEIHKDLAVGDRPMRISERRPEWNWSEILLHPAEEPFRPSSTVRSIEIQYPARSGWATGRRSWLIVWFLGSTLAAFLFRGLFKVKL